MKRKHSDIRFIALFVAMLLFCVLWVTIASAEEGCRFVLPQKTQDVQAQAFQGNVLITAVEFPAGILSIDDTAFAECESLTTVYGVAGTCAETWAMAHNMRFIDTAATSRYPESQHPYSPNADITQWYTHPENADQLLVTFSKQTETEQNWDYVHIIGNDGQETAKYSGYELSGATICVRGSRFGIRLTSDNSQEKYGYSIDSITLFPLKPISGLSVAASCKETYVLNTLEWSVAHTSSIGVVHYKYTLRCDGTDVCTEESNRAEFHYKATTPGMYILSVTAADEGDNTANASAPVVEVKPSIFPHSPHPYTAGFSQTYNYEYPGECDGLIIRFSEESSLDSWYDRVIIKNSMGYDVQFDDFDSRIILSGNSFTIEFTASEDSSGGYGFDVIDVQPFDYGDYLRTEHPEIKANSFHYTHPGDCDALEVTFSNDSFSYGNMCFYGSEGDLLQECGYYVMGESVCIRDSEFTLETSEPYYSDEKAYGIDIVSIEPVYMQPLQQLEVSSNAYGNSLTGRNIEWQCEVTEGKGRIAYQYTLSCGGKTIATESSYSPFFSYTPTLDGEYELTVSATDAAGTSLTTSSKVNVVYPELHSYFNRLWYYGNVGSAMTCGAHASGGSGSYLYDFSLSFDGESIAVSSGDSNEFCFTPEQEGTYTLSCCVQDTTNTNKETIEKNITVSAAIPSGLVYHLEDVYYSLEQNRSGEAYIESYIGSQTNIEIPEYIGSYKVTAISQLFFNISSPIEECTLPSGVSKYFWSLYSVNLSVLDQDTFIGILYGRWHVNNSESALKRIHLKAPIAGLKSYDGVLYSEDGLSLVFCPAEISGKLTILNGCEVISNCSGKNLTEIILPNSLTTIGYNAFANCSNLTEIILPSSVTAIGRLAFSNSMLWKDRDIALPSNLVTLGERALYVQQAKSIAIGAKLTSIGPNAFGMFPITERFIVDSQNPAYKSIDGSLYSCENQTLLQVGRSSIVKNAESGIYDFHVADGTTALASDLFDLIHNLRIWIPESVTAIDDNTFESLIWASQNDIIVGKSGSYAEAYARTNGFCFYDESELGQDTPPEELIYSVLKVKEYGNPYDYPIIRVFGYTGVSPFVRIPASINGVPVKKLTISTDFCADGRVRALHLPSTIEDLDWLNSRYPLQNLYQITVDEDNEVYYAVDGVLYSKTSLVYYPKQNTTPKHSVPAGILYVDLPDNDYIQEIVIPSSVTNIDTGSSKLCDSLRKIEVSSENTYYSSYNGILYSADGIILMYCPQEHPYPAINGHVTTIRSHAFEGCHSLTSISIPDSVTSIGSSAFSNCDGLTSIIIPGSVTSIEGGMFSNCGGLTSVTIPDGVTSIGDDAFYSCDSLTSITIPDSVTSIGGYAFHGCDNLTSISIPDSITSIEYSTFSSCGNLISITIPDSVISIGDSAFSGCHSLTSIIIPDSVTSIMESAFYWCDSLTSITIPDSVTSIGSSAFSHCDGLTSITIPDSVTSIGSSAFSHCDGLTSITIPGSVTSIESGMFSNCGGLTSITIPDSVTSIGDYAFGWCSDLTSITIPSSVTSISTNAFVNTRLLTVYGRSGSYAEKFATENGYAFVSLCTTATLSGNVLSGDTGVQGIAVTMFDVTDSKNVGTTHTLSNGSWSQGGLTQGHTYTVSYRSSTYDLTPASTTITVSCKADDAGTVHATLGPAGTGSATVSASSSANSVETGVPVNFIVSVHEANQLRLIVDDVVYESYVCDDNGGIVQRAFTKAGNRIVKFQAGKDGVWGAYSNEISLTVTSSKGMLESAIVNIDDYCQANQDTVVTWQPVINADQYTAYVFVNGVDVYHKTTTDTNITIPGGSLAFAGGYAIEVVASANGYTQSSGSKLFEVVDKELSIQTDNTRLTVGETASLRIVAPGADYIKVDVSKPTGTTTQTKWDNATTFSLVVEEEGAYIFHISVGRNNEETAYAQDEVTMEVYHTLLLSQTKWYPTSVEDTLAVTVTSDINWEIVFISDWLSVAQTSEGLTVSIIGDTLEDRAGSIELRAGNTTTTLYVYGPSDVELSILSPTHETIDHSDFCTIHWSAVDDVKAYYVMVRDETVGCYIYLNYDASQSVGDTISPCLLIDDHRYSITVVAWRNNNLPELRATKTVTVHASSNASITGKVVTSSGIGVSDTVVYAEYNDRILCGVITDATGAYEFCGLAPNSNFTLYAQYGDYVSDSQNVIVSIGTQSAEDIIIASAENPSIGEIDIDEYDPYFLDLSTLPQMVTASQTWLKTEVIAAADGATLKLSVDTEVESTNMATVVITYAGGVSERYNVNRSIPTSIGTQYLAETNVAENISYNFRRGLWTNYSTGNGTITETMRLSGKTIIEEGDTITLSDEGGSLVIDGDLEIKGTLILKERSYWHRLQANNITITGLLVVEGCSMSVKKSLKILGNGSVSVSNKITGTKSKSVTYAGSLYVDNELRLESNASLYINGVDVVIFGRMNVLGSSTVTQTGGTVDAHKEITFNSSSSSSLNLGTINAWDAVTLKKGYRALSKDHELNLLYDSWGIWTKQLNFEQNVGQKIGYLNIERSHKYSGWKNLKENDDYYESNIVPFGAEVTFDTTKLKLALTYTNSSLYSVTPWTPGAIKLTDQQQSAIVLEYIKAFSSAVGKNITTTSMSIVNLTGETYTAYYFNDKEPTLFNNNEKTESITFTIDSMIGMSGTINGTMGGISGSAMSVVGTAWITINGKQYVINAANTDSMIKMVKTMQTIIAVDAATAFKNAMTTSVDSSEVFGKNGVITYLKKIFDVIGINTDQIITIEQIKKGMEAESVSEYREALKRLIEIAVKYK